MGISLSKIFKGVAKIPGVGVLASAIPVVGPIAGGLITAYQGAQALRAQAQQYLPTMAPRYDFPSDESAAGGASGPAVAVGAVAMLSPIVRQAIIKLAQRLGGGGRSVVAYGRRVWEAITGWVQRNPGTSAITMLTGLGLTLEEAAHFLAWGAATKRRRRARGISARDMRITRRTTRKLITMTNNLRELCGSAGVRRRRRVYRRGGGGDVAIVQ